MTLQSSALPVARSQYFPLTQQIWRQAWHVEEGECLKSLCAKIACIVFPIIAVVAVVETILLVGRKVVQLFTEQSDIPGAVGEPIVLQPPIKVDLQPGCSQFDIVQNPADPRDRRPPACTFHSMIGASIIAEEFEKYFQWIESQDSANLSAMQRDFIVQGTGLYFGILADHPQFAGGADLEDLKKCLPDFFIQRGLYLQDTNQDPQPVAMRVAVIVEHLFAQDIRSQVAWIKNGNEESFSVICNKGRAIIFDSHKKAIYLIRGKEQVQRFLAEILTPYADVQAGSDLNAFSYALGYMEK